MNLVAYGADGRIKNRGQSYAPQGVVCQAYLSANTAAAAGQRKVPFNAVRFDPFLGFDVVNSRFQPKLPGYYRLSTLVDFSGSPGGTAAFFWFRNGASYSYGNLLSPGPTSETMLAGSVVMYLNGTTDYAEVFASSTGSVPIGGGNTSYFDAELVASAVGVAPEPWHVVGTTGEPAFLSGWSVQSGGWPLRFMKDPSGFVTVNGRIASTGVSGNVFTLPAGYRPPTGTYVNFPVLYASGSVWALGRADIDWNGLVRVFNNGDAAGAMTYVAMDVIRFRAEQ